MIQFITGAIGGGMAALGAAQENAARAKKREVLKGQINKVQGAKESANISFDPEAMRQRTMGNVASAASFANQNVLNALANRSSASGEAFNPQMANKVGASLAGQQAEQMNQVEGNYTDMQKEKIKMNTGFRSEENQIENEIESNADLNAMEIFGKVAEGVGSGMGIGGMIGKAAESLGSEKITLPGSSQGTEEVNKQLSSTGNGDMISGVPIPPEVNPQLDTIGSEPNNSITATNQGLLPTNKKNMMKTKLMQTPYFNTNPLASYYGG